MKITISKNIYINIKDLYKNSSIDRKVIEIFKGKNKLLNNLDITNNTITKILSPIETKKDLHHFLSVIKYLKDSLNYYIRSDVLRSVGYVKIDSDFMEYLMIRFTNCEFLTFDGDPLVNITKPFIENPYFKEAYSGKINIMKMSIPLSTMNFHQSQFIINTGNYLFISYICDFYSPQINVISYLKQLGGYPYYDDLSKLRILLNYSPIMFLFKNKSEVSNFIKTRMGKEEKLIPFDLMNVNRGWNYAISGQTGSGHSKLMNALLSLQLNEASNNQNKLSEEVISKISDLHLKFASKNSYYETKMVAHVS